VAVAVSRVEYQHSICSLVSDQLMSMRYATQARLANDNCVVFDCSACKANHEAVVSEATELDDALFPCLRALRYDRFIAYA
jgi:hypothetical protein